jgi:hypothetical protein
MKDDILNDENFKPGHYYLRVIKIIIDLYLRI